MAPACLPGQVIKKSLTDSRGGGQAKARASPLAGIRGKSELRHQKQGTADILQTKIHLAPGIGKNPIAQKSLKQPLRFSLTITPLDTDQDE